MRLPPCEEVRQWGDKNLCKPLFLSPSHCWGKNFRAGREPFGNGLRAKEVFGNLEGSISIWHARRTRVSGPKEHRSNSRRRNLEKVTTVQVRCRSGVVKLFSPHNRLLSEQGIVGIYICTIPARDLLGRPSTIDCQTRPGDQRSRRRGKEYNRCRDLLGAPQPA